jgi:hypothetical protein
MEDDKSIWNVESLKVYHDDKIMHVKEITDLHFQLNQTAIDKAALEGRLKNESMNEWRDQNKDLIGTLASKDEVKALSRLVYIGFGIFLVLTALLQLIDLGKIVK